MPIYNQKVPMKPTFLTSIALALSIFAIATSPAKAWFAAGTTPGWAVTTTGLRGQVVAPFYLSPPAKYTVGDTFSVTSLGINDGSTPVTAEYWLAINRVLQSPIGTDITDGTTLLTEDQLNSNHQASNDTQTLFSSISLGSQTFPAQGSTTFSGGYTTTATGCYQYDVTDLDPSKEYLPGHILTAGFFCVVTPVAPSPTPTVSPTPDPMIGKQSRTDIAGEVCKDRNFDARIQLLLDGKPVKDVQVKFVYNNEAKFAISQADGWAGVAYGYKDDSSVAFTPEQGYPTQLQKVTLSSGCKPVTTTVVGGSVLGATTYAATGAVEDTFFNVVGLAGSGLTMLGSFLSLKKRLK